MKNIFKSLMLVAVAAMAFTACQKDNNELDTIKGGTTITFNASFAEDTRVALTDEDSDNTYQATFEAFDNNTFEGDKVTFVVYRNEAYLTSEEVEVTADGATATFVVKFDETLEATDTIVGYLNYYWDSWYEDLRAYGNMSYQVPAENEVTGKLCASTESITYGNQGEANLAFSYDNAFCKMTFTNDLTFNNEVVVTLKKGENSYSYRLDEVGTKKSVMFACDAIDNVELINISTMIGADEYYFEKENPAGGELSFVKGRVSAFTVTLGMDVRETLATPVVNAELNGEGNLVFSWAPVENAKDYTVSLNYGEEEIVTACEYIVAAAELQPFSYYELSVVANPSSASYIASDRAYKSYATTISKNAAGEDGYTFTYDKVEELGGNKYKFYNDNANEYLLLAFASDITTLAEGSYEFALYEDVVYGENSAFRHPNYENGSWIVYYLQDNVAIYVDVTADGKFTITTFCKRFVNDDNHLYKGVWSGKFSSGEEPEPTYYYDLTFDTVAGFSNNLLHVTNSTTDDYMKIQFNPGLEPIEAGTYTSCIDDWSTGEGLPAWSSASALEYHGNSSPFYNSDFPYPMYLNNAITVEVTDEVYTITTEGTVYINDESRKYRLSFTGTIEATNNPLDGYEAGTCDKVTMIGSSTVLFNVTYLDSVVLRIYGLNNDYTSGSYDIGTGYVETLTLAGFAATSGTVYFDKQGDGSFLIRVDAEFSMVGAQKFYFYATLQ